MRHFTLLLAFVWAFPLIASGGPAVVKLYDRRGSIQVESLAELEKTVISISYAAETPIRDKMQDIDGLPMFLLANERVTILVKHTPFGEHCDWSKVCEWEYSITSTDVFLDEPSQQKLVDGSFASLARLKL